MAVCYSIQKIDYNEKSFFQLNVCCFLGNGYPKYGGIGGQGGCVQFVADEKISLNNLAKK